MPRRELLNFLEDRLRGRNSRTNYDIRNGLRVDSALHRQRTCQECLHTRGKHELVLVLVIKQRMHAEWIGRQIEGLLVRIPQRTGKFSAEALDKSDAFLHI